MSGVGPAGRVLMVLKERGARTKAMIIGGSRRAGGRMERRNDSRTSVSHPQCITRWRELTANFREPQRRSMMRRWYTDMAANRREVELV